MELITGTWKPKYNSEQTIQLAAKTLLKRSIKGEMPFIKMKWALTFDIIEKSIVRNKNFAYTIVSFLFLLAIFMNLNSLQSPLIGLMAFVVYFVINSVFLGNAFFEKETAFIRLMFGVLLLVMFLGFVGWLVMIIYNLDVLRVTLVLVITTTLSSLLNKRMKHRDAIR